MANLSPGAQEQARAGVWQQIVADSSHPETNLFDFGRFLRKVGEIDPATRDALWGTDVTQKIGKLETVLQRISAESGIKGGAGGLGSQIGAMAQTAGAVRYLGGIVTGSASLPQVLANGMVLISPSAIAKLVTSPKGIDLLVQGLQIKPGTMRAVNVGSVVATQMARLLDEQTQAESQRARLSKIPPGAERSRVYRGAGEERVQ